MIGALMLLSLPTKSSAAQSVLQLCFDDNNDLEWHQGKSSVWFVFMVSLMWPRVSFQLASKAGRIVNNKLTGCLCGYTSACMRARLCMQPKRDREVAGGLKGSRGDAGVLHVTDIVNTHESYVKSNRLQKDESTPVMSYDHASTQVEL